MDQVGSPGRPAAKGSRESRPVGVGRTARVTSEPALRSGESPAQIDPVAHDPRHPTVCLAGPEHDRSALHQVWESEPITRSALGLGGLWIRGKREVEDDRIVGLALLLAEPSATPTCEVAGQCTERRVSPGR